MNYDDYKTRSPDDQYWRDDERNQPSLPSKETLARWRRDSHKFRFRRALQALRAKVRSGSAPGDRVQGKDMGEIPRPVVAAGAVHRNAAVAHVRVQATKLREAEALVERLRKENTCSTCCGDPVCVDDCICGGPMTAKAEVAGFKELLRDRNKELIALRAQHDALRARVDGGTVVWVKPAIDCTQWTPDLRLQVTVPAYTSAPAGGDAMRYLILRIPDEEPRT